MKNTILTVCLTLVSMTVSGVAAPVARPEAQETEYISQYDTNEGYVNSDGYNYEDDYNTVDWNYVDQGDMNYSYYDNENVFMVTLGRRVFIVPYDFFYYSIWPHHRNRLRYYACDHFSDWWGLGFYNHVWYRYNHYHNYGRYARHHDFYREHRRRPRVTIHKDGWRAPRNGRRFENRNRYQQNDRFKRTPRTIIRSGDQSRRSYRNNDSGQRRVIRSQGLDRSFRDNNRSSRLQAPSVREPRRYSAPSSRSSGTGSSGIRRVISSNSSSRSSNSGSSSSGSRVVRKR